MTMEQFFFTKTPGIGGRIKKRISDFLVKEITPEGETLQIKAFAEERQKIVTEKNWPQNNGKEQLSLTMEKFNLDLNDAVRTVSRGLGVSGKRIGYAGMKDKRAISVQKISIWRPDYEKIKAFNSRFVDLRDAEWSDTRIELGDLWGNEFEITVREIELDEKETEKRIIDCFEEMKKGIPNYFGLQRFGGIRAITHLVGKELLKGNIESAVMLYLTATAPEEDEETKNARQELSSTRDFSLASKKFPNRLRYERAIIHHLCKYPKDFAGAFSKLPKKLRIMFTHAYQSHLFNKIINKRITEGLGLKPSEGDILEDGIPTAPLVGFETTFAGGKAGEIEQQVLEEEEMELSEFKLKKLSELSSKGTRKPIALFPQQMELLKVTDDELNKGLCGLSPADSLSRERLGENNESKQAKEFMAKAIVSFKLTKGNYATTVIREIMKKEPR